MERVPPIVITGTGDSDGYLTVAANTGVFPGAEGYIRVTSDSTLPQKVRVTDVPAATKVGLQFIPESTEDPKLKTGAVRHPSYGRNSLAAYAAGATLALEAGLVPVKGDGITRLDTIFQ